MPLYHEVSSTWEESWNWINVSGTWKKADVWVNVSGTWKRLYAWLHNLIVSSTTFSTTSTTAVADDELQFTTQPNTKYYIEGCVIVSGNGTLSDPYYSLYHSGTTSQMCFSSTSPTATADLTAALSAVTVREHLMNTHNEAVSGRIFDDVQIATVDTTENAVSEFRGILAVGATGGTFSVGIRVVTGTAYSVAGGWLHWEEVE